ncbi:MAG: PIN domain-containing protein [Anaeromyxobacteraceae bacterium]
MVPAPFVVIVDANLLYPFTLRDTILRAAARGFFQLRWSREILDEMERNLVEHAVMPADRAARLRAIMEANFPEADVSGYELLTPVMPNHEKDRHVAAAAVKGGAQVIATANLRHFELLPDGVEAQAPDAFLCNLFDLDPNGFVELLAEQAEDLKNPPMTFEQLLGRLARDVPELVAGVLRRIGRGGVR